MIFKTILSAAFVLGSLTTASALDLRQVLMDNGDVYAAVPLPPRRGQGGSVYAIVSQAASRHGVPHKLAHAVIHVESKHNCSAKNQRSSAAGLGQLIRSTARSLGVRNSMSCSENADGAMRYLAQFYRQSGGNWCVSATAYNRGSIGGCSVYGRKVVQIASR